MSTPPYSIYSSLSLQIFPDNSYTDYWAISTNCPSQLMHSDSFSARSNVVMGTRQRRHSSTGDVELVQRDINKAVEQLTTTQDTTKSILLPVKMEAIGTPSSIDSTEESTLHPITMVTQQQSEMTEDIINLNTTVANDNKNSSDC